jgi:uncharacterized protein
VNISNSFTVPLKPADAWRLLMDVKAVAGCVPGATIAEVVDERSFRGTMRVRLGPVMVNFAGLAQFESIDEAAKTAILTASGEDTGKRGSAQARTHFRLQPADEGSRVDLDTDLQLAGMIAQYGRAAGLIAQIAQELLDQFAEHLRDLIARRQSGDSTLPADDQRPVAAAPREVSGLRLLWRALLRILFGRPQAST